MKRWFPKTAIAVIILLFVCLTARGQKTPPATQTPDDPINATTVAPNPLTQEQFDSHYKAEPTWPDDDPAFKLLSPADQKALKDAMKHLPDKGQMWYVPSRGGDAQAAGFPAIHHEPVKKDDPPCVEIPLTKKQRNRLQKILDNATDKISKQYDRHKADLDQQTGSDSGLPTSADLKKAITPKPCPTAGVKKP